MVPIQSFSTAGIDPRRKLACWNEWAGATFSPLVSDPADVGSFHGSIERTAIGEFSLAEAYSEAQIVRHSRAHVARTRGSLFFLLLQLSGESTTRQEGREAFLKPGDFTLCDSTRQYDIVFPGANRMLVLGIPDAQLRRQVACPESLVAHSVRAHGGVARLLSRLLNNFWVECHQELDPDAATRVTGAILELLGAAYTDVPRAECEHSGVAAAHRIRIRNYIEAHLHDPQLSPTRVAQACRITPRYLHHLFAASEETVGRYVLRRRLEGCARALSAAVQSNRTVAAIAFDYGFNSPTHFGRVFRSRFRMTPREYREKHTAAAGSAAAAVEGIPK
jgi:AraC-like DNA-binding protein